MANRVRSQEDLPPLAYSELLTPDEINAYTSFLRVALSVPSNAKGQLLSSIPQPISASYGPFAALYSLIHNLPAPWPRLELQQTYSKLWKYLPEEARAGQASPGAQDLLDRVSEQCKQSYSSINDLLHPTNPQPAIIDPLSGKSITHQQLAAAIEGFELPIALRNDDSAPVVAISLPNGPLLAMTVLATATFYTAAPMGHGNGVGAQQLKADVLQSRASVLIASASDASRLGLDDAWLEDAGVQVLFAELDSTMNLVLSLPERSTLLRSTPLARPRPNGPDDIGILLFTSGTSGSKKLVPLRLHSMIHGVAMVAESWDLSSATRCLNQMPLNHVGGLVRNLLAPVMTGGSVICCSAFDPNAFWDCVEDFAPTWYYASPSMHQGILEAVTDRPESLAKSQIRLVCNAAGGLLPSLAVQIRDTFSTAQSTCVVLPSYGMTECMPISTPPLSYQLQKTGTSGISVGPEVGIFDGDDKSLPAGDTGKISVRGAPVFGGYLKADNTIDKSCFNGSGWFDTGDLGHLDEEGYLYITGRSKEVINRGGELISPFEVEEAVIAAAKDSNSAIFGKVTKALAFSVSHGVLQEVVGIVITKPPNGLRPSLRQLQEALKSRLAQVKIPVLVVYMDDGIPTQNNKILRIKLADRLGLAAISDSTPISGRHFEAVCPPLNTPLSVGILCDVLSLDYDSVESKCRLLLPDEVEVYVEPDASGFYPKVVLAPKNENSNFDGIPEDWLLDQLAAVEDDYHVPTRVQKLTTPFRRSDNGNVDLTTVVEKRLTQTMQISATDMTATENDVAVIFSDILSLPQSAISQRSEFFDLGGDSMKAGRLLSSLRKRFQLRLPINVLFDNPQVSALAAVIDEKLAYMSPLPLAPGDLAKMDDLMPGCEDTCSSTNPLLLVLQLTPILIFWPMRRALTWTIFMYCLSYSQSFPTSASLPGRLLNLVLSMGAGRLVTKTVSPLLAILCKWAIIGRYREGVFMMWGRYHTRWWFCEKIIATAGMGIMSYSNWSRVLYLRLMGAKVGKNVILNRGATLGEYDLITIEDNVVIERCKIRPMAPERNTSMYLGRILIGANASIGLATAVAPGSVVPRNACIGPNSSSWECEDGDEANRDLAASKIPGAHWALTMIIGTPIKVLTNFFGALPWLACLIALVYKEPVKSNTDQVREIILWFASPGRVAWHYAALAVNVLLGPMFLFASVVAIKRLSDLYYGRIGPSLAGNRSETTKFRMELMRDLMPAPRLHDLTELFGTHYEATSVFMRAMGAKIGKNVYWPGTGPSLQDYDLIEVGHNVIFGSRAHIVTSDGTGSDYVRVENSAMIADRVILLPGSLVGDRTVMGSGALARKDTAYPADTTWVGSKKNGAISLGKKPTAEQERPFDACDTALPSPRSVLANMASFNSSGTTLGGQQTPEAPSLSGLEKGFHVAMGSRIASTDAILQLPKNDVIEDPVASASPFARAFYHKSATYRVWSQFEIFLYSTFIKIFTTVYWNIGSIATVQIVARIFRDENVLTRGFISETSAYRAVSLYVFFWILIIAIMAVQTPVALLFTIGAKWLLMGRRQPGDYDWDESSYCQRWQLFLKIESLRRNCYGGNGILGMLTGTHWIVLYFRALGAKIGKDCALFAGGQPSLLFTEPDLITLGDRVSVDDASVVGHINSAGHFSLNKLSIGDRSVLRSGSRLLSGASCEEDTCLLEHTLVSSGDTVEKGVTMQGWPAEEFKGNRMPTLKPKQVWAKID